MGIVRDEGVSAKDLRRPGLGGILAALPKRSRGWEALVVVKLDRLTRSVRDLAVLTDRFRRARVALVSIQETVDTHTAAGELFFNLVASISQWERRAIGERTAAAMAHLRGQGRRVSRFAPYGYCISANGRALLPQPKEQVALAVMRRLAPGRSLRELAQALAARGIVSRSGRPLDPKSLARLVAKGSLGHSRVAG